MGIPDLKSFTKLVNIHKIPFSAKHAFAHGLEVGRKMLNPRASSPLSHTRERSGREESGAEVCSLDVRLAG